MKVVIEIPNWLLRLRARVIYWKNSIKWIVTPPRCDGCGARMHATHYHMWYNHKENGTRLLVENMGIGERLCPSCITKEVINSDASPYGLYDEEVVTTCDCCQKEDTTTYRFYETAKIRLHYCIQWWNGFHICKDCTVKALQDGYVHTGMSRYVNGKAYNIGAYGLFLNSKGKVQLFRWNVW